MSAQNVGRWPVRIDTEPHGYRSFPPGNAQFYSGQMVMLGKDDGLVKPVSGSTKAVVVGVTDHYDINVTAAAPLPDGQLRTQYGCFGMFADSTVSASGTLPGALLFAVDDQTVTATQTGALPVAGRLHKFVASDPTPAYVLIGTVTSVSGSTI